METTPINHDSNNDLLRAQLFVFVGDLPIAFSSNCGLETSTEEIDTSNKMTGDWSSSIPGKKSFTLSCEALVTRKEGAMSYDTLLNKQAAGETLDFFFGNATVSDATNAGGKFTKDTTQKYYTGKMMITSLSLKSDNGQIATCSASFKGIGALIFPDLTKPT